jgi:hypothetical protein
LPENRTDAPAAASFREDTMNTIELEKAGAHAGQGPDNKTVEVTVNDRTVTLIGLRHTGLEIKEAAIARGVPIQPDFVLSIERGQGQTQVVGDTDVVTLHPRASFVAIADDDNS